ncbi:hypothetical protein SAMN06297129_2758 [Pseudooceanicola antarcticus]|uniref:N-acetyltransferase domain-containing protein n=2 Tax=Pseudooceanicola antarcticus TaxID=1247613 RepID=A0A285J1G9_9RHOB|nr:GNAT family N-acetyltransferase [Pseudooceanicola antarcticus]PJE29835.1 hypothetical protein CVM39_08015 [Pseudooceanicola antarcticus]SNY54149.1 hypothetical protein SAMN06297129_2758 [Pseudooceanicola antarcticus]
MLTPYLSELSGSAAQDYAHFDLYWQAPDRQPWVIGASEPQGFALIRQLETSGSDGVPVRQVAEFYIRPEARRAGLGQAAAAHIFAQNPGLWQIGILAGNAAARLFWPRAVAAAGGEMLQETHGDEGVARLHFQMKP